MTSPGGELRLSPHLLHKLATMHGDAAALVAEAIPLTDRTAASILKSHGPACLSTSTAAEKAASARKNACIAIQTMSEAHEQNLNTAAAKYAGTDREGHDRIHNSMPPR
ncbi:type VII secretion target [[Mycobacterium] appelbergii]|uniref:type VII secretion target n=1 Tax=[Mycobacterium] appelbergii TaxID=2939269 RepID=UPI003977B95E